MNNKKVLAKYPTAIAVEYKTQFDEGFRPKGVSFFIIQEGKESKYSLGFGLTEKYAWMMATIWLKNDMSFFKDYKGYPIEDAKLEME
tara:strand:+ start:3802 stop:4062 length:261 start_codon:yes stop_codon:yes gene_type:complete